MSPEAVREIVERSNGDGLISILQAIQAKFGYLEEESLKAVSEITGRSLVDIYGVATFYKAFSLLPRGEHLLSVCLGTACHVRGAPSVAHEFMKQLNVKDGETTPDRKFTLETANCLGACALGPIVVVDGVYYSKVKPEDVKDIIESTLTGTTDLSSNGDRLIPLDVSCPHCNHTLMDLENKLDGRPSISVTLSFGRKHGYLRLSSLYGSFKHESDHEVPDETVVNIFCPHCHTNLSTSDQCNNCGELLISMIARGGGVVQVCSKKGCKGHSLDITGVNLPDYDNN